jgi:hypothetical protein
MEPSLAFIREARAYYPVISISYRVAVEYAGYHRHAGCRI